jgi:FKBP-type peptidyl-prolyl cis-trans isomerase
MIKKIFFALLVVVAFAGCLKHTETNTTTCTYDPCAYKAKATEVDSLRKYLAANNITATEHCSGVFYKISNPGTGATPIVCKRVAVRYKGMLTNGNVFDEQTSAQTFYLNGVITGWTNTVPLIKEGGSITLYIPPSLGYGSQDVRDRNNAVVIPANSILVFTINLDAAEQ